MPKLRLITLVLALAASALAYNHPIPEVDADVHSMLGQFGKWTHYAGPTGRDAAATRTGKPKPPSPSATCAPYWLETIRHQGRAAFNPNPSGYQVFRNVRDFGAQGDGVADDTAAINAAISSGGRCAPGQCQSSTTTPAVVYFPTGTYLLSASIIDYYETQLIGNPNCPPVLRALANFTGGLGVIDGSPYQSTGNTGYGSTNTFYRQIRNFVIDLTNVPASSAVTGIHWPTAQATSLQNIVFQMSQANGTQHQGIFIESGSGGFMNDLTFYGGLNGVTFGNQQFTVRNLAFYNAVTAINQIWDWGWTYKSITINNCTVGLSMNSGGPQAQSVGSVTFFDSTISNTKTGFLTAHNANSLPPTGGSLIIENVQLNNVPVAVQGPDGVALAGTTGSITIAAWGEGHSYTPNGPNNFEGPITPFARPGPLLQGSKFYERSKPQYESCSTHDIISVRDGGARGDGTTDDTDALQRVINRAASRNALVFIDHGTYKITETLFLPANTKMTGETYPVFMSSGDYFADINNPKVLLKVGDSGDQGAVELSDFVVATQGAQAGAILIEWNLASSGTPSGAWDVHSRIGGFAGSHLQIGDCPTTPNVATPPAAIKSSCIAAYMSMHVTPSASGLYLENVWLWTADHDLDDANSTQITVYTGRGLYIESTNGNMWLVGTAVEHHSKYQYQFANTQNVFQGQIQTETAYYQPNPNANLPFPVVASLNDPVFLNGTGNNADGWGLRILKSHDILTYGAGLYSFFNNYSTACSNAGQGETCQTRIFSIESSSNIDVYNLNTIGAVSMIDINGQSVANQADNTNAFPDTIALFRSN